MTGTAAPDEGARARNAVVRSFLERHPAEAAQLLETCPTPEVIRVLVAVPASAAAAVLERLSPMVAGDVIAHLGDEATKRILPLIDLRRAAAFLAQLDEAARAAKLDLMDAAVARELRELMSYPANSAGSLMDPRVLAFRGDTTVREVLQRLRKAKHKRILDLFVIDGEGRLVGSVTLETLVLAGPETRLEAVEQRSPTVRTTAVASREEVVETFEQQRVTTLPVVDAEDRLLGVIRYDTLVAAVEAEATTSIQTMVGASKDERALSKVSFAVRKRLPWLQVNLVTAFLAAAVVGLFEGTIARFTALAVLLPVVAGQSGNTGAQALAVTMRGLTLREIRVRQWMLVVMKEVRVGFLNGIAVALTTGAAVFVWSGSVGLVLIIGASMVISMVAAALAGAVIPIVLTAIGQDPAQSSSIVLTTVTDIVGFFSFLGIATMFAGMLEGL
jgi:magnesium transporter